MSDDKRRRPMGRNPGDMRSPLRSPFGVPASGRDSKPRAAPLAGEPAESLLDENVQRVTQVDSFYDGVPAENPKYFMFQQLGLVTQPLVAGTIDLCFQRVVPDGLVMDVSNITIKFMQRIGANVYAWLPDDIALLSIAFDVTKDALAVWDAELNFVPFGLRYGVNIVGQNLLALFEDTPGHLVIPNSSTLRVNAVTLAAGALLPAFTYAVVTVYGRWIGVGTRDRLLEKERGSR